MQDQRNPKRVRVAPNLYQRPKDGRFECGYTGSDGKWHMKTLSARTLTEAKREQRDLLGKRDRHEDVSPRKITLNEVADEFFEWFATRAERGERSERTLGRYRQNYDLHIRPTLGRKPGQTIRLHDVSRFLAELRMKEGRRNGKSTGPLSDWTIRGILTVLSAAFKRAVKLGYVTDNPVSKLADEKPPAKNRTKARILEPAEITKMIAHALPGYRALIMTAVYTGMRQSELLGLCWRDVDFESSEIYVRYQLSRATKKVPAKLVALKTDAAERDIDLAPTLATTLREHRMEAFKRGHAKPEDFVFCTETGKPIYYRNASVRGLTKAADRAGLNREGTERLSFHDLRHTAITHLIRSGADVAQVQRFAGHAKPSITLDIYVGEFESRKSNDSGQRLAEVYSGAVRGRE